MSDALTPLRHVYGVDAPGRDLPGEPETVLLAQTRTAVEAATAAQDRRPSDASVAAVLAEAERKSAEALAPLAAVRALYGASIHGTPDPVEAAVLSQTRAAVERAADARPQHPSTEALAAVVARAAEATHLAPAPDALVEASELVPLAVAYGLPVRASVDSPETALLVQTRSLLDTAPVPTVSKVSLANVLARAAEASRVSTAVPDAAVEVPALAPLAATYGLPLAATAGAPSPAETALLSQTRTLLSTAPSAGSPSDAVIAAVLARASAEPVAEPTPVAPAQPAADRSPVRAARSYRRAGAWASAAMLAVALVVALLPDSAGAPELAAVQTPEVGAETVDTPDVTPAETPGALVADTEALDSPTPTESTPEPIAADPTPRASAPVAFAAVPPAARPADVSRASAPRPVVETRRVADRPAPPTEARPEPAARSADPTLTLASTTTSGSSESWEAADDVRVLSLRLQELRRGNEGLSWDAPVEAFGAPTTRSSLTMPALQNVRTTVPPARARLRTDPAFGDR